MVAYIKDYSYLRTISYDVIILICYSKGQGSKLSIFKFPMLWGLMIKILRVFNPSHVISEQFVAGSPIFEINAIIEFI